MRHRNEKYCRKLGDLLRKLRLEKSYSQENMADELDISQSEYSRIEAGIIEIGISRFKQIAEIFEIDIFELLRSDLK